LFTEICHLDNRRENVAPLDKSQSSVRPDALRKLAFSTLAHDILGITPLAAGMVTTLRTSAKNSVRELIDYASYPYIFYGNKLITFISEHFLTVNDEWVALFAFA
jgi:hypothetical protein